MSVGANESPDVGSAAAAGLARAGGQLAGARQAVAAGTVRLDPAAATALLSTLDQLTSQAANLVTFTDQGMDQQLHLGHNWIGAVMDQRLRGAVNGGPDSLRPVLAELHTMLGQVADTVRQAAGMTTAADQESADRLRGTTR
ncbi:MAG TPA: hypothetical protein VHF06_02900 [Pseudonocardiaceae bacterium]|jgi:hypothetical protein|nr:hypothetical protein [Pseudonocardiaceae bacterium]